MTDDIFTEPAGPYPTVPAYPEGDAMDKPYAEALHAMQCGVAMEMNYNAAPTSPKHLRVGVNAAMCDHAALARLLVEKGVLTWDEYHAALAAEMNREVERYEKRLSEQHGGATIHLH